MQVRDLQQAASTQTPEQFRAPLGVFVLLQRPPAPVYHQLAKLLGRGETVGMAHESRMADEIFSMTNAFESLEVLPLPTLVSAGALVIGRAPESNVVIHEPSVSSSHATLRWDAAHNLCSVKDHDSRNGTFVNAKRIFGRETPLADGDAIAFGDAQFLFLRAESLQQQVLSFARLQDS